MSSSSAMKSEDIAKRIRDPHWTFDSGDIICLIKALISELSPYLTNPKFSIQQKSLKSNLQVLVDASIQNPGRITEYQQELFALFSLLINPSFDQSTRNEIWFSAVQIIDSSIETIDINAARQFFHSAYLTSLEAGIQPKSIFSNSNNITSESLLKQTSSLMCIVSGCRTDKKAVCWWRIIADIIFPKFFDSIKSKDSEIREIRFGAASMFLNELADSVNLDLHFTTIDPSNGSPQLIRYTIDILRIVEERASVDQKPYINTLLTFLSATVPCKFMPSSQEFSADSSQEDLPSSLPHLLVTHSKSRMYLLSSFMAVPSPKLHPLIESIASTYSGADAFFLNWISINCKLIDTIYDQMTEKAEKNEPTIHTLQKLLPQMMRARAFTSSVLNSSMGATISEKLYLFALFNQDRSNIALNLCAYIASIYDRKTIIPAEEKKHIEDLIVMAENNQLICQILPQIVAQIATSLAPALFGLLPEINSQIFANSVAFERNIANTTLSALGRPQENSPIFYYPLNGSGWTYSQAETFISGIIQAFDSSCHFVLAAVVADCFESIFHLLPNDFPLNYSFLLEFLFPCELKSLMGKECAMKRPLLNSASALIDRIGSQVSRKTCYFWIRIIHSEIWSLDEEIQKTAVFSGINAVLRGFPLSFSLIDPITVVLKSMNLEKISEQKIKKVALFAAVICLTEKVKIDETLTSDISKSGKVDFFACNPSEAGLKIISDLLQNPRIPKKEVESAVFVIFFQQALCNFDSRFEEIMDYMLKTADLNSSPAILLLKIIPQYYNDIAKFSPKFFNLLLDKISFHISTLQRSKLDAKSKELYTVFYNFIVDLIIVSSDKNLIRDALQFLIHSAAEEELDNIIADSCGFLLENMNKPSGFVIPDERQDFALISQNNIAILVLTGDDGSIKLTSATKYGSSKYLIRQLSAKDASGSELRFPIQAPQKKKMSPTVERVPGVKSNPPSPGCADSSLAFGETAEFQMIPSSSYGLFFQVYTKMSNQTFQYADFSAGSLNIPTHFFKKSVKQRFAVSVIYSSGEYVRERVLSLSFSDTTNEFRKFLESIGGVVDLKSEQDILHRNDKIALSGSEYCLFWQNLRYEVIYYVSPFISSPDSAKKWENLKKSSVFIVWAESKADQVFRSVFDDSSSHIYIIISPMRNGFFRIAVKCDERLIFGPLVGEIVVPKHLLGDLVRWTALFASTAASQKQF